jgi:hypothetical protein
MRTLASPRAALVLCAPVERPADWPPVGDGSTEANLGHAPGWSCEVRRDSIVLVNPLGEGLVRADLPELSFEWLQNVRHDGSCAVYLADDDHAGFAELIVAAAALDGSLGAATVRTAVSDGHGQPVAVGRNDPCPCGSGKKFKRCHG